MPPFLGVVVDLLFKDKDIDIILKIHKVVLPTRKLMRNMLVFCGVLPRITTLTEWRRHCSDLAVGETAAPACFSRENAEGAGMPPLLNHCNDQTRSRQSETGTHTTELVNNIELVL